MNMSDMIERLEDAIQVCYDVGKDKNKGYPYATGYAQGYNDRNRMAIKGVNE